MTTEQRDGAPAAQASLASLATTLQGRLVTPGAADYDAERMPWNLAIDQRPVAIAHPSGIDDVRALLAFARDSGATLTVQPNGHGASSALEGSILTRPTAFDRLEVDVDARTAVVGAGVQWGTVIRALEGTGLVVPSGTSRAVSPAGYLLSGGHSWLSRWAGLGAQSLRAAWIVRPDGTHERVDDASHSDTMWALRGGGGAVGIVTELEIDLLEAPALFGGSLLFSADDGPAVLRAVRDAAADAPEGLGLFVSSMRLPDAPMLPEEVRGRSFTSVDVLARDESDLAALAALRTVATPLEDRVGATTQAALAAEAVEPDPAPSHVRSIALDALPDASIDDLLEWRGLPEQAALIDVELRMLGGALDAPQRPGFATLAGASWLSMGLVEAAPETPPGVVAAILAGLDARLRPHASERMVPTFLGEDDTLERCATADDVARLRAIRDAADPQGVLHEGRLPR